MTQLRAQPGSAWRDLCGRSPLSSREEGATACQKRESIVQVPVIFEGGVHEQAPFKAFKMHRKCERHGK